MKNVFVILFCCFSKANQETLLHEAPSWFWQGSWIHLCFFPLEVRLNGCLKTCHPERLLCKAINCSILLFTWLIPTLVYWLEDCRNYHVLCDLILSCKIFHIYDNSPVVWLFHIIVIVFFCSLFMIIFAIILAKKRDIKSKLTKILIFSVI